MPLYLVRWPDLSAALIRANSEAELLDKLDEVDNPEGCTWTVYRGPLHLEFTLPVRFRLDRPEDEDAPLRPEEIVLEEIGEPRLYPIVSMGDLGQSIRFRQRSPTPLLRSKTPLLRSKTPLLRSKTPLLRSKTPLLRSETPLLRSRTPLLRPRAMMENAAHERAASWGPALWTL